MAIRWRADNGPTLNASLVALQFFSGSGPVLLENLYFVIFQGGGGSGPLSPPLWIRACIVLVYSASSAIVLEMGMCCMISCILNIFVYQPKSAQSITNLFFIMDNFGYLGSEACQLLLHCRSLGGVSKESKMCSRKLA